MSITVVGSVGLDTLETPVGKRADILGGSACHFSFASSVFGGAIQLVGVVGDDFPKEHINSLKEHGISLEGLEVVPGKTFRWHGKYENFGEAISLATELNVFEDFSPKIPDEFRTSDILFLGNIDPVLQSDVLDQMVDVKLTVMDTMNFWIDIRRDELTHVTLFANIFNEIKREFPEMYDEQKIYDMMKIAVEQEITRSNHIL